MTLNSLAISSVGFSLAFANSSNSTDIGTLIYKTKLQTLNNPPTHSPFSIKNQTSFGCFL